MIDTLLNVVLGFLAASLLGLAGGRLLWSRAVRLTLRRLEGNLPSSMGEIVAAQDMIRAEHAIRVRGLERMVSSLRSKLVVAEAAAAMSDTDRSRLIRDLEEKKSTVLALDARIRQLEGDIAAAQGSGEEALAARDQAREEFAAIRKRLDKDSLALAETKVEIDAQQVRLVAVQTEAANHLSALEATRTALAKATSELARQNQKLEAANSLAATLQGELAAAASTRDATTGKLSRLEEDHQALTRSAHDSAKELAATATQLEALKTIVIEREKRIAALETEASLQNEELAGTKAALKAAQERETRDTSRAERLVTELEQSQALFTVAESRAKVAENERDKLAQELTRAQTLRSSAAERSSQEQRKNTRLAASIETLERSVKKHEADKIKLQDALVQAQESYKSAKAAEDRAIERIKLLSQQLLAAQNNNDDGHLNTEAALAKVNAEKAMLEGQLANARAEWSKLEKQLKRGMESGIRAGTADTSALRVRIDALADEIALFAKTELPPASTVVTQLHPRETSSLITGKEDKTRIRPPAAGILG